MVGLNHAASLNDAKELQRMFKGQSGASGGGKPRGKNKAGNSFPMKRQETSHSHRAPPPASTKIHVPLPSLRYYTATLLSDPLKRAPGSILGKATLDFLTRQEPAPQVPPIPPQTTKPPVAGNQVTDLFVPTGAAALGKQDDVPGQNKKFTTESENHASVPVVQKVAVSESNVELLRNLATEQREVANKAPMTVSTGEPKTINKEGKSMDSIANTFFSLMSGDSEEESDEEPSPVKFQDEAVNKSIATTSLRYSSDEILKLKANAKEVVLPSNSIVKRTDSKKKSSLAVAFSQAASHLVHAKRDLESAANSSDSQKASVALRAANNLTATNPRVSGPQTTVTQQNMNTVETSEGLLEANQRPVVKLPQTAEVSTQLKPEPTKIKDTDRKSLPIQAAAEERAVSQQHRGKTEISSASIDNTSLRPEAPGFVPTATPNLASLLVNGLSKPAEANNLAGNIIRSTCLSGQMIIVTPIQIADGQLISGPPSGQLVMQSTTPGTNQTLSPNTATPGPFVDNSPFPGAEGENNGSVANASKIRKLTKGLGSSMWAK
ncbi:hypothetical protein FLONG3_1616 [Fusarium longipes]|uniref:Uncharacterized protein n=1 Tax=Fusarium longipes TaxID=694270 RepID=A0A395T663_9HYPO|nr:hypothetical protein FLONG3_1616 [Fusarium longipes]